MTTKRTMINRYPGTCICGARVEEGAGTAIRWAGRWRVRCTECNLTDVDEGYFGRAGDRPGGREDAPGGSGGGAPTALLDAPTAATGGVGTQTRDAGYVLISGHPASPYQAAVFDHFRYGRGSVIINAVAGSGKTTTMKNALRYLPAAAHVQMLAFNVEAADQLKAAIAELEARGEKSYRQVRANSFNSLGMGAVRRALALPDAEIRVEPNKCRNILRTRLQDTPEGEETLRLYAGFATHLVRLAKGEGVGCLVPDLEPEWYRIVDHHGLYLDAQEASVELGVDLARRLLRWSNDAARAGLLDYDDQLYLVVLWKLRLWRNDVVIADECQDINGVQRAILHLALKDGGRLYAVGDRKQAIYGFRGASADAIDLIQREFAARELPLTVSYRCSRQVVERAQTWVPYIEPAETAPEGEVRDEVPLKEALSLLSAEDAVLCRQTAPLVGVAYGLIARGRPCRILGREIGEGLVNLIEQQRARGVDRLVEKLTAWREREMAKFIARGEEGRAEAVADRVDCVLVIADALPETDRTVPALVRRIQSMFVDPKRGEPQTVLTLSTAHKAKGKEWDRVAILRPELMPSRAARQDWQMDQETNLQYVAATRAKTRLIYCAAEDVSLGEER